MRSLKADTPSHSNPSLQLQWRPLRLWGGAGPRTARGPSRTDEVNPPPLCPHGVGGAPSSPVLPLSPVGMG